MVQHGMGNYGDADGGAEEGRPGTGDREERQPVRLVAGRSRLTLNPVDGSEVELCPEGELPRAPRRLTRREREINARHASGGTTAEAGDGTGLRTAERSSGTGPGAPGKRAIPMLERDAERRRLVDRLRQGRSVRITGLPGSGRTTLLDAVASDVAGLAPDGVVRLSGRSRTVADLQHELFAAVHDASRYRPDGTTLRRALRRIGAVVVVDDLAFGGEALGRLLDATPECAYLLSATPEVEPPSGDVQVEEFRINGLSRNACLELLEHAVRRPLSDEEADAAQDMWAVSEEPSGGLPLRFVQAGALLRYGGRTGELDGRRGSAMSARVAERTSAPARDALRFALALGGELPHPAQLPALIGDRDAQSAAGELTRAGLVTAAGPSGCLRLAEGVAEALTEAGFADGTGGRGLMAAHHYAWWAAHPSVPADRVAAESDAVLAAVQGTHAAGHASAAVLVARAAAPALAAGPCWGAWDRMLRAGLEASRTAGEVAQEAYFQHELGVLALCSGRFQRAAAELEASIALRGALQDQQGMLTGRRVLALARDLLLGRDPDAKPAPPAGTSAAVDSAAASAAASSAAAASASSATAGAAGAGDASGAPEPSGPAAAPAEPALSPAAAQSLAAADLESTIAASLRGHRRGEAEDGEGDSARTVAATIRSPRASGVRPGSLTPQLVHPERTSVAYGVRRNLAAAGAGAVLIAVLATIVGLGKMPDDGPGPLDRGTPGSSSQRDEHSEVNAEDPERSRTPRADESESDSPSPSSDSPSASESADERPSPSSSVPKPPKPSDSDSGGTGGSPTDPPGSNGGTDSGGSDSGGTDSGGTDSGGTDSGGTDGGTTDGGTDSGGTDDGGTTDGGTDSGGTDDGGTTDGGTTDGGTDTGGTTSGGTNSGGSDSGGTTDGGGDSGGTDGTGGTVLGNLGLAPSTRQGGR